MRLLLDTHCWLWMQVSPERFSARVLDQLTDPDNVLFFSAASSWEIAIKWAIGKLPLPQTPEQYVPKRLERQGIVGLSIQHQHTLHTASLPQHHNDPFDRLLVAQARVERLTLVTADKKLSAYEVDVLMA